MTRILPLAALFLALAPSAMAEPPGLAPRAPMARERPPIPPHVIEEVRQQESEILAWVEENDPDSYERLTRLKDREPRVYLGHLVRASRMMERAANDPEVMDRHRQMRLLEIEVHELVSDWSTLSKPDQRVVRREAEAIANKLFELKQEERRAQLEAIRQRMQELEREIENRDSDRKDHIDAWLDQIIDEPVDL